MPFTLNNVGATYQRLIHKVFFNHIGENMEVYIDYMVLKSNTIQQHVEDPVEIFCILKIIT